MICFEKQKQVIWDGRRVLAIRVSWNVLGDEHDETSFHIAALQNSIEVTQLLMLYNGKQSDFSSLCCMMQHYRSYKTINGTKSKTWNKRCKQLSYSSVCCIVEQEWSCATINETWSRKQSKESKQSKSSLLCYITINGISCKGCRLYTQPGTQCIEEKWNSNTFVYEARSKSSRFLKKWILLASKKPFRNDE